MAQQPENDGSGRRRRILNRRSAGGMSFSGGGLSQSSSGMGNIRQDDDDQEIEDLNAAVAERVSAPPRRVSSDQEASQIAEVDFTEEYTPGNRLAQVRSRSTEYEHEYRLGLLHRLIMRNIPLDEIAQTLGISIRQVQRDRKELAERLRRSVGELDIEGIIGESMGFYGEIQAMSMRAASQRDTPMAMKLAAMRVALASHNDKHRFFQAAGVYDVLRFRKGAGNGPSTDIQRLMGVTDELLEEARRERRTQDPLGDFSSAEEENVDL